MCNPDIEHNVGVNISYNLNFIERFFPCNIRGGGAYIGDFLVSVGVRKFRKVSFDAFLLSKAPSRMR
jgi:hypothetical protein